MFPTVAFSWFVQQGVEMTLLGRQLASHGGLLRGFGQACSPRQVRPLMSRPQSSRRTGKNRLCTDATLARDMPESALPQRVASEALLLRRYKAHDAAVTATLVLNDKGNKEVAGIPLQVFGQPLCELGTGMIGVLCDRRHKRGCDGFSRQIFGIVEASGIAWKICLVLHKPILTPNHYIDICLLCRMNTCQTLLQALVDSPRL